MKSAYFFHATGIIILLAYVMGYLFPETWWTTHFLFFAPTKTQIALALLVITGFLFTPLSFTSEKQTINTVKVFKKTPLIWPFIVAALFCIISTNGKMVADNYGEAYILNEQIDKVPTELPAEASENLFSFGLSAWDGQKTIFSLVTYIAHKQEITYREAFHQMNAVCAFLFSLLLILSLKQIIKNQWLLGIMVFAGLCSPFVFNFFGHTEINSLVLVTIQSIIFLIILTIQSEKKIMVLWLWLMFILSLKFHAIHILFFPVLVFISLFKLKKNYSPSLKNTCLYVLTPVFLIGAFLYFFVFEDYKDPRHIQFNAQEYDRLFLPLLSPEPPHDTYNLLSFNHIFDYFSMWFVWFPSGIMILVLSFSYFRKRIDWNNPLLISSILLGILFLSFFFVLNPLLSMQMDWDLFCLPAPIFILLTAVLIQSSKPDIKEISSLSRYFIPFSIISLAVLFVHTDSKSLSKRLTYTGYRIYNSYYEWASQTLEFAIQVDTDDKNLIAKRREEIIEHIRPSAQKEIDFEFARLLSKQGKYFLREAKEMELAEKYLSEAYLFFPKEKNLNLYLLEYHFLKSEFKKAYYYAINLIEMKHPGKIESLKIAVHVALEAGMYRKAQEFSGDILKIEEVPVIREVYERLKADKNIEDLKLLFRRN